MNRQRRGLRGFSIYSSHRHLTIHHSRIHMSNVIEVKVPDIGGFKDVPVIEVLVKPGDSVKKEDPLITLESDKATMEVPAPQAGVVKELKLKHGDKVSQGSLILMLEAHDAAAAPAPAPKSQPSAAKDSSTAGRSCDASRLSPLASSRKALTSTPKCWCWAPDRAATLRRSAPPISARKWCWSSASRRWAACASTSAASRRRRCCTSPGCSPRPRKSRTPASSSASRK